MKVLLLGNPNSGKTTLFNALTGENQRIGNWSGVTVEQKQGFFPHPDSSSGNNGDQVEIIDLPGIYSVTGIPESLGQDELITLTMLARLDCDVIVNVVDACHLERHLYLTSQLLELGKPIVLALNMIDIAQQRDIHIDISALSHALHCPVVPLQAHRNIGVEALKNTLITQYQGVCQPMPLIVSEEVTVVFSQLRAYLQQAQKGAFLSNFQADYLNYVSWRILEGDSILLGADKVKYLQSQIHFSPNIELLIADARYQAVHEIVEKVQRKHNDTREYFTAWFDRIVLHRILALPLFLTVMYGMFLFAIDFGGVFQDFFDQSSQAIFVQGSEVLLQKIHAPVWVVALIAHGIGQGINTTITFIPVLAAMYFALAFLETSGYMARAAFIVDKIMRMLGLPGKAFVPMIVGFGCNVPAILATRTIQSERDRIVTILMSPFMSCSARLAIYAIFVAAFFPSGGQNIVFSLYLIGISMAILTGYLLRKTLLSGEPSMLILELPAYHKPSLRRLLRETFRRLRYFIVRAGKVIIPCCMVLGCLNVFSLENGSLTLGTPAHSLLALIGKSLTPIFSPMGIQTDNWPATVGLLTGMFAKEVVIGTLSALYGQMDNFMLPATAHFDLLQLLKEALWTIPTNFYHLSDAVTSPLGAAVSDVTLPHHGMYGALVSRFDGKIGAFSYLLFILLYIPCVSTVAVIRQEANRYWMWFSIVWSLGIAYTTATVFYQCATFLRHPLQSAFSFGVFGVLIAIFAVWVKKTGMCQRSAYVAANS